MRTHLIEPHAGGRISGGYLYNQCVADGVTVCRHAVRLDSLAADLSGLGLSEPGWVLADSLFLRPQLLAPFLGLRRPGLGLGVLLHALPSFIERASRRDVLERELPLRATPTELALLETLDLLVAPGPYVPRLLAEQGSTIRCLICPPGVDRFVSPRAREGARGDDPVHLISLGGVSPLKGFGDALRALGACTSREWQWSIVGNLELDPVHVSELLHLRSELGLEGRVHLLGQRDHPTSLTLLGQSDALLLPSFTENAPLVALEALAAGVPVVGYAAGGLPELLRDSEAGLLAPLLDVQGLSERLRQIIEDGALRARLSRAARSAGQALPSWSQAARDFAAQLAAEPIRSAARPRTDA